MPRKQRLASHVLPAQGPGCPVPVSYKRDVMAAYPGMALEIYRDDPSGWRTWLVLGVGRKWITLFSASSLDTLKVKASDWGKLAKRCYAPSKASIIRIIERNLVLYCAEGLQHSATNAKAAVKLVRRWKGEPQCSMSHSLS